METSSKGIGITPLDWLMLGGALLALAVTAGYAWYTEREAPPSVEVECVFLINGVERQWLERYGMPMERGDGVRSENGTVLLGEVISVGVFGIVLLLALEKSRKVLFADE